MVQIESLANGSAHDFHHTEPPTAAELTIRRFVIARTAIVLGSSQPEGDIDRGRCSALDIEVARRQSGGGAVLLVPGHHIWIDVLVPRGHLLWDDDVSRASHWLGRVWRDSIVGLATDSTPAVDVPPPVVHEDRLLESQWSRKVCFAGVGPGEVVDSRGRKLVGISQRRTREWARMQCIVSLEWDAQVLLDVLSDPRPTLAEVESWGAGIAAGPPTGAMIEVLLDGFVSRVRQLTSSS